MFIYFFILINIGNSFSSPYCEENAKFCSVCNPITKLCEKCEKDIYIPDQYGGCEGRKKCILGNNHCLECQEETNLCRICEERYFPDENGGCSYTSGCKISYQGICLECKDDSILIGNEIKICKLINSEDLKNCEIVNKTNGLCDLCREGYYLNSGDKKCINIEYCLESSFGVCTKCQKNYYLDKKEDKCKKQNGNFLNCTQTIDGKVCDLCDDNYYLNKEEKCIPINYCEKEIDTLKCEKCKEGYYLTEFGNACTKEKNCYYGNKDFGICTECQNNYYIDFKDGKCKSNEEENDFKYCRIADGECKNCIYGAHLGKDNKCSFSYDCLESDKGKCIQCLEGYYLSLDNKCTNLEFCIYTDFYGECTECKNNYYYNRTSKMCEMKENFENCRITYDGKFCDRCKKGFYLNKTDYLCYSNIENTNFYKCALTNDNGEICSKCENNYYLGEIDFKCSTVEGCNLSENENRCLLCDSNYYCLDIKTGKCEPNDEIESEDKKFYFKCNRTNKEGTSCEICIEGYRLNKNGLCVDDYHCSKKNENGICIKCINYDGDYFSHCLNKDFECVETYFNVCEECNNSLDFDNCTKCIEGYELNEKNICVEIKK